MKCKDPVLCYIKEKGVKVYRHFSLASDTFKYLHRLKKDPVFNCGKCLFCRKKRAYELACRCVLHASLYQENCFLTLTYDEKKKDYHNEFQYRDIQTFKKRLRSHVFRQDGRRIEAFNVHEYGRMGKKHWHLIVFNYDFGDRRVFTINNNIPLYTSELLSKLWPHGFSTIGDVSEGSAMYQSQYAQKDFKNGHAGSLKRSHSKHSGIGRPYFEKHYKQILMLGYIPINGRKLPLPRYFLKVAKKHWAWHNDRSLFLDTSNRKALFTPFTDNAKFPPNREISELYAYYMGERADRLLELEKEWDDVISQYLTTGEQPDFIKSHENALYDLRNKTTAERF